MAASGEREPGKRNHGVASPVAEPGVAGDHGGALQLALGIRAPDDELVGRQSQTLHPLWRAVRNAAQQCASALLLALESRSRGLKIRLGGRNKRDLLAGF